MHAHGQGFIPNPASFNPPVYNFPDLDAAPYGPPYPNPNAMPYGALNFGHPMHGNGVGYMNIGNMKHNHDTVHNHFHDNTNKKAKHEHDFNAIKKHKIKIEDEDDYHVKSQKTQHNPTNNPKKNKEPPFPDDQMNPLDKSQKMHLAQ